jgi:phosphohistidine swiveling domain-containing protein
MATQYIIPLADPKATLETAGGKGASLARLTAAGLPVPDGFHVSTEAYRRFVEENSLQPHILEVLRSANPDQPATLEEASRSIQQRFHQAEMPPPISRAICRAYANFTVEAASVAVRSSATAEDLPELSFAGQQETYLNVRGADNLLEAVKRCWASLWTARAIGYRERNHIDHEATSLAVVVQLLVPAEAAGILFTANPVTGARSQATISAAWGLGEAVVGGLVTPDTLTVEKASGKILARVTAQKQVMTVRLEGGTQERPVPDELQDAPVLDDDKVRELVQLGVQIERLYGRPMDIEWTHAEGRFAIVQARPITALQPDATPPSEWPMPDPKGRYMRQSIVDLMPDPLTPLFATMGLSAINRMLGRLVEQVFDAPAATLPTDVMVAVNGYAYMTVSFSPKQWWAMLTKMVPKFPRMLRTGVHYWRNVAHPRYVETMASWQAHSLADLSAAQLLTGAREVLDAAADHLGALMASTMGPSAGSEGLFTRVYERMIQRPEDPSAPTFLMGFDSIPILAEKALYDLALWCRKRPALCAFLEATSSEETAALTSTSVVPSGPEAEDWLEWQNRFKEHLWRFGYSIYTLDFGSELPLDDPAPLIEMVKRFLTGQGKSPYERQKASAERREAAVETMRCRLGGIKRWAFEKTLAWAQSLAPLREDGIAEIGLGYPLLRRLLRELGSRLLAAGAVEEVDDIFWLRDTELVQTVVALAEGTMLTDYTRQVVERKALWQAAKGVTPPPQLPASKTTYMGINTEGWLAPQAGEQLGDTLKGLGASPGRVTAPARVLHGPEDFGQMKPGDILVAGITTPAWTPLFALASGVITDVGGPLSHGSIVAREYGIPAVLGTGVATKRIQNGQIITLDGTAGTIHLGE